MIRRLFFAILLLPVFSCRDAEAWIRKLKFNAIRPPSNLLSPGAIVMRKHLGNVRLLCTAEESLGAGFVPSQSRTVGGRMARTKKIGWHLDGDALEQIKVTTRSDSLSDVHIQISNARILSLTDVDVLLNARNRSDACAAAIRRRKQMGWDISMVSSSLKADVTFGVKFHNEGQMDATAKLAQLQAVSVSLGGQFDALTENSGYAKGLSWGFRDDEALAAIATNDPDVVALRGQKAVPSNRNSIFLPEETLTAPHADEQTQTDEGEGPAWGVTTDEADEEAIPGAHKAFDGATAEDERTGEEIDEDDYQDMLDKNNHRGRWAPQGEPEIQDDAGFVPSEGGAPAEDEQPPAPVSPRSPRAK